ncbi:MAG: hypothetical protein H7Z40_06535 [Phycisphaerae bacterium]|nr:hypothetical protein [Gemmatimonadaceae bacterium]
MYPFQWRLLLPLAAAMFVVAGCARSGAVSPPSTGANRGADPREGLRAGLHNAGEAVSNMKVLARAKSPAKFDQSMNSDIAFTGKYAIQGNFNGFQVWDISNPSNPTLTTAFYCPASQSDVSVYKNLLFVSGESPSARLDCGDQGVTAPVSAERLRGIRIFDITDIKNPKYLTNVQTCRGSHTHTVLEDPKDRENVYIYVSGSAPVRPAEEMAGCISATPDKDANSALFRIEVIKVPLANPSRAAIIASPRIFNNLTGVASHGASDADKAEMAAARAKGAFTATIEGEEVIIPSSFVDAQLTNIVKARSGTGAPTAADSAKFRAGVPAMIAQMFPPSANNGPKPGPNQCHDITVYPALGLAGGACEGYGLLLDIRDPANPVRIGAVSDSNFAYWHSATFNNDGTKVLFSDEWGGGTAAKCRATDKKEWGADAIFTIENGKMNFKSYYKIPAKQTAMENCVAHNGSLIPIPDRDVMVQAWYQGGISVFDWTDASNPMEIASFDRGPVDSMTLQAAGSWSVYWYNGAIVSSEIMRGLDIAELVPSQYISQNEIDAAKTVKYDYLNAQGQPKMVWPPSFSLAKAYVDQLERKSCVKTDRIAAYRSSIDAAEKSNGGARRDALNALASQVQGDAKGSCDVKKMEKLAGSLKDLMPVVP